jgi:ABC-type antimicrobial peptide transport system permease subunit
VVFSARTSTDPATILGALREALRAVDPEAAAMRLTAASTLGDANTVFPRITGMLSSVLGTLALVLALAGLYGILAHLIAGRTREIGIRLALGASASRIRRQVLFQGMSPVLLGLVAGQSLVVLLVMAVPPAFVRLMPGLELAAMLVVPALFIAAGLAACYLPALRASRVDPNVALRSM